MELPLHIITIVYSYPLVDRVVLAVMKPLFEVEYPHGCAGVDVVVIEHTINCYVLPGSHHHFLRNVAYGWKQRIN